jgi:hypothetical protein
MLWFAHGSASYRKHFRPPLSPSRSPAATSAAALQKRWDHLRAGLDLILNQRDADMPICPGAPAGCSPELQGEGSRRPGDRHRPRRGLAVAELRVHVRQAAEELGQWKTASEERKILAASPAAITRFPPLEPGSGPRSTGGRHGRFARRRDRVSAQNEPGENRDALGFRRSPQGCWPRLQADASARRVSLR